MEKNKIFTCANFKGVWLGGTAVVAAPTRAQAARMLTKELNAKGNMGTVVAADMKEFPLPDEGVRILTDWDY